MKRISRRDFLKGSAAGIATAAFSGFGLTASAYEGDLEYVELDWYVDQDECQDNEMVQEYLNEYLLEKLNCKVNFHFSSGYDYSEAMATKLSAGEDVGLFSFCELLDMNTYVSMDACYPMNELLENYGSGISSLFTEEQWNSVRFNDEIYAVPTLKDNASMVSMIYNADMADALGIDMSDFTFDNWRSIEDFLMDVVEKRNEMYPEGASWPLCSRSVALNPYYFALESINDYYAVCNIPGIMDIEGYDENTVFNLYATDEFREFVLMQQRLTEAGVYAWDYNDFDQYRYSEYFFARQGLGYTWVSDYQFGDQWAVKLIPTNYTWTDTSCYQGCATAISVNCKDPERAMMVLELVNTDPEFATMLRFGIEGEHYVISDDGEISFEGTRNEDATNRGWYYWYGAYFGNVMIVDAPSSLVGPNNEVMTLMQDYNENAYTAKHMGFTFDQSPVQNQVAACSNVIDEYFENLVKGCYNSADDVEEALNAFLEKLEANGVNDIIAEAQAQIDEWSA